MDEKPQVKKRIRKRSIAMQLQIALKDAELAATSKETDEYTIARMRLLQTRLKILSVKEARERASKWKVMQAEIASLRQENAKLKTELSSGARAIDCGDMNSDDASPSAESLRLKDEALDRQVAAMMEQIKAGNTTPEPVPPRPAPVSKSESLIFPWRTASHEPGDAAPRISPSKEESQGVTELHQSFDARFSQRSVAERVARIEREARDLREMREQSM